MTDLVVVTGEFVIGLLLFTVLLAALESYIDYNKGKK